jgi:gamma-glutamyltranspeptidase
MFHRKRKTVRLLSDCFLHLRRHFQPTSHADTFRPVVRGKRGVVAGGQPLSVEAGLRILQRGGNAVDAGVATILAASVIEFSHFSFGGEVPILIKLKGQKWCHRRDGPGADESHARVFR